MQSKISKTLEAIIASTSHTLMRNGTTTSFSDRLIVELLANEATFAHKLLETMVGEHGISVIIRRIMSSIITSPHTETRSANEHYAAMKEWLSNNISARSISSVHVLYAVAADTATATARTLRSYGIIADDILTALNRITDERASTRSTIEHLDYNQNTHDPHDEIGPVVERIARALTRRKKCNPILIEEAGVGTSTIAQGLALSIAQQKVPCVLANKQLYSLDVAMLIAGTKYSGELKDQMQKLITLLQKGNSIILLIDEIHAIDSKAKVMA